MAKKDFMFRGKSLEELKNLSLDDFIKLIPSKERRSVKRGFTDQEKILLKSVKSGKNNIETHCRDMVIIPDMVGKTIKIHNGKEFVGVILEPDMLGHRLGEFVLTRKKVAHSAPGIGATKSSASLSVK